MKHFNFFKKAFMLSAVFIVIAGLALTSCDSSSDDNDAKPVVQTLNDGDTLSGTFVNGSTITVAADATITLSGTVKFNSGAQLVINEGVTVEGDSSKISYLIIDRGATITAIGTAAKPIVFTSDKAAGSRARQDWGGIVINGYAPVNVSNPSGEGDSGTYGGNNTNDNSGTLKYVRVEFAGKIFSGTDELNGIAFQGVGDGTTIDYVQTHNCADDGMEFFGGSVNVKHIVTTGNGDDAFDWVEGWQGKAQFIAIAIVEGDSDDPRGIEGDNLSDDNEATPISTIEMYNVSVICDTAGYAEDFMRIRRGTQATIVNGYIGAGANVATGSDGVKLTEDTTKVTLKYFLIEGNIDTLDDSSTSADRLTATDNVTETAAAASYLNAGNISTLAELATNGSTVFVPASANTGTTPPADGFFDTTANFVGAVKNGDNWIAGWTSFPAN